MRFNRNNHRYVPVAMPNDNWLSNNGIPFVSSEDGTFFICDRGAIGEGVPANRRAVSLPSYSTQEVNDFYAENGYLDHKHVKILTRTYASSVGASDGWIFLRGV